MVWNDASSSDASDGIATVPGSMFLTHRPEKLRHTRYRLQDFQQRGWSAAAIRIYDLSAAGYQSFLRDLETSSFAKVSSLVHIVD